MPACVFIYGTMVFLSVFASLTELQLHFRKEVLEHCARVHTAVYLDRAEAGAVNVRHVRRINRGRRQHFPIVGTLALFHERRYNALISKSPDFTVRPEGIACAVKVYLYHLLKQVAPDSAAGHYLKLKLRQSS